MQNLSIQRTSELPLPARRAVEALLGRALADDEDVGIWASKSHVVPQGESRETAWKQLHDHLDLMASQVLPGEDAQQLADDVSSEVRHAGR